MKLEAGQTELPLVLPQPVNRHLLLKSPISPNEIKLSKIMTVAMTDAQIKKEKQSIVEKQLVNLFPDQTMKYEIVAKAKDCAEHFEVGNYVSFTQGGNSRPHQMISNGDYLLVSEGDVGLLWSKEAIEYNMITYKEEEEEVKAKV
jgi:uncharacterized membrane protein YfhO